MQTCYCVVGSEWKLVMVEDYSAWELGAGNGKELYAREVYLLSANIQNLMGLFGIRSGKEYPNREDNSWTWGLGKSRTGIFVKLEECGHCGPEVRQRYSCGSLVNSSASPLWRGKE